MLIIERIFNIMKEKGIKDIDLANKLNISKTTVSTWKRTNKNPPCEYIERISELLDTKIEYLITGKDGQMLTQEEAKLLKDFSHCSRVIKDIILDSAARGAAVDQQEQKENLSTSKTG